MRLSTKIRFDCDRENDKTEKPKGCIHDYVVFKDEDFLKHRKESSKETKIPYFEFMGISVTTYSEKFKNL